MEFSLTVHLNQIRRLTSNLAKNAACSLVMIVKETTTI